MERPYGLLNGPQRQRRDALSDVRARTDRFLSHKLADLNGAWGEGATARSIGHFSEPAAPGLALMEDTENEPPIIGLPGASLVLRQRCLDRRSLLITQPNNALINAFISLFRDEIAIFIIQ